MEGEDTKYIIRIFDVCHVIIYSEKSWCCRVSVRAVCMCIYGMCAGVSVCELCVLDVVLYVWCGVYVVCVLCGVYVMCVVVCGCVCGVWCGCVVCGCVCGVCCVCVRCVALWAANYVRYCN